METRRVRKELQVLYATLNTVDYRSAQTAINDFLDFLKDEEIVADIITPLPKNSVDIDEWVKTLWNTADLALPRDKKERMAFLLAVIERYKDDIMEIVHYFHSSGKGMSNHVHEYVESIIRPVYQYLDTELHRKELETEPVSSTSITAGNVIMINGDNYGAISQNNNEAIHLLNELASKISNAAELEKDEKLEAIANIDTVKAQMSLPKPNWQIVKLAWSAVSAAATTAGAIDLVEKISKLLS